MGRIGGEILVLERQRRVADVLRHVDDDRSRPARGRDREGAAHELGDALDALDADQLLAAAGLRISVWRDSWVMFFQECSAVRIADEHHHRRAGVERLDEPGDEVRGAGAERRVGKADPARDLGVGVGREDAGALVVDEVVRRAPAGARRRRTAAAGTRPCRTSGRPCGLRSSGPAPRRRSSRSSTFLLLSVAGHPGRPAGPIRDAMPPPPAEAVVGPGSPLRSGRDDQQSFGVQFRTSPSAAATIIASLTRTTSSSGGA